MLIDGYNLKCKLCGKTFFTIGKKSMKEQYLEHIKEKHPERMQQAKQLLKDV